MTRPISRLWPCQPHSGSKTETTAAATIPAFSLQTKFPSINDLPRSIPIVRTVLNLNKAFPGTTVPAVVVVHAPNVKTAPVRRALAALRQAAVASDELTLPIEIANNPANTVARVRRSFTGRYLRELLATGEVRGIA